MKAFLLMLLSSGYIPESIEWTWLYDPATDNEIPAGVIAFRRYFNSPYHSAVFSPIAREDYNEAWDYFHDYWRAMNTNCVR